MQIPRVVAGVHRQVARFAGPPVTVVVNVTTVVVALAARGLRRKWPPLLRLHKVQKSEKSIESMGSSIT